MLRNCESCGSQYEARSVRSRFCSDNCRVRNSRGAAAPDIALDDGPLVRAVMKELAAAGKVDSMRGQQALVLARRMSGSETNAGVAALSRELRSVMAAALGTKASGVTTDGIDELRARRDEKRKAQP